MDRAAAAVTRAISIVLMTPKVGDLAIHALALTPGHYAATLWANGFVRRLIGCHYRLLAVGELGNFHKGCFPLSSPSYPICGRLPGFYRYIAKDLSTNKHHVPRAKATSGRDTVSLVLPVPLLELVSNGSSMRK